MRRVNEIVEVRAIDCRIAPYEWDFARDERARIDAHWAETLVAKPALFDGRVLVFHALDLEGDTIAGSCFETSYKAFLSWRDFAFPGAPVVNAFAMPALRSIDGAFMLGEMSVTTANGGRLYFPAGTPEPSDADADGRVDFDANILRELAEETGLTAAEITLASTWTVVFAGPLVAFMKVAQSRLTAAALQDRVIAFNATVSEPELARLVPVRGRDDYDIARTPAFMLRYLDRMLPQAR